MSKRGKVELSSDDRIDSPAPVRRSTRISSGQNVTGSPAPIKTRRGSANSNSEEKISVEANVSPKDKRKTRRTSADEEPKSAPVRGRRSSLSKVIEEEKTSIPNSPSRKNTRLSSSSPTQDVPVRRTRRSSQDAETVEIPARRTTRRSSTGIQECTIEEIVEKAKPITRRRRSSSIDEEENAKIESARSKTKRLFNEDNHLEPIKEQEQEIKQNDVKGEKEEKIQKLEVIEEITDNDESEKIIEDLNKVLQEKSSPNKSISKSSVIESDIAIVTDEKDVPDQKSVESSNDSPIKTIQETDAESPNEEKVQSITKKAVLDQDKSTSEDVASNEKLPLLENPIDEMTNEKDNPVEKPIVKQRSAVETGEDVSYTLNEDSDTIELQKELNKEESSSSPGSDKENTSMNVGKKRLSIKKIEQNSKNETAELEGFAIKRTPNNTLSEPMDIDDDEDDLFAAQAKTKIHTPEKSSLNIVEENDKTGTGEDEAVVDNGDVISMNTSAKENDNLMEGSFSHVNSSPDKESSLLVEETITRSSQSSSTLSININSSIGNVKEVQIQDDCESDASIKLVDTDDEEEATKMSSNKEDKPLHTSEISSDQTPFSSNLELTDVSNKLVDTDVGETSKIPTKNEDKPVLTCESSVIENSIDANSELIDASIELDDTDEEKVIKISTEKGDEPVLTSEISTDQKSNDSSSELNDASFKLVDTCNEEKVVKISTEIEDKLVHTSESSNDQNPTISNSKFIDESNKLVETIDLDEAVEISNEKKDESVITLGTSTNQTLNVSNTELNESVFDKSFESMKNNSSNEGNGRRNEEIVETDHELSNQVDSEETVEIDLNEKSVTSLGENQSSDLNISKKYVADELKRRSGGNQETDQSTVAFSSVTENNHATLLESNVDCEENAQESKKDTVESKKSSSKISLGSTTTSEIVDEEVTEQSLCNSGGADSRKSLRKSMECNKDIFSESLHSSGIQAMDVSLSKNSDSKVNLSLEKSVKDLKDESHVNIEILEEHPSNMSTISGGLNKDGSEEVNETVHTESTMEINCSNQKTKTKNPCKIILQNVEYIKMADFKISNDIESLKSYNQERDLFIQKSSSVRLSSGSKNGDEAQELENSNISSKSSARYSLTKCINEENEKTGDVDQTKYEEKSPKSNVGSSTIKIPTETGEIEDEIHLISSSDDEIHTLKNEESPPTKTQTITRNSKGKIKNAGDEILETQSKSNKRKSVQLENSRTDDDKDVSLKRKSKGSEGTNKLKKCPEDTTENNEVNIETKQKSENKKRKTEERMKILQRSGIDVEDEDLSAVDFIDDIAEEGKETLSEEEIDENEIIDIGESVLNSGSDTESSQDDYDTNDSFIDDEEQEDILSGEEHFLEEEKPKKKKFKRIKPLSYSPDANVKISKKDKTRNHGESPQNVRAEFPVETAQIAPNQFEVAIDSILNPNPGECSTPIPGASIAMNSSHVTESSVILQETCSIGVAKGSFLKKRISGVVDTFCDNITENEGDISVNVSLNYKPPTSTSSRNSLNPSRTSLNEKKGKSSLSPRRLVSEIAQIENQNERNTKDEENGDELPIKVAEETKSMKKKKISKKSKEGSDLSLERKQHITEERSSKHKRKALKRPAEQESNQNESENSQTKQKATRVVTEVEVHAPPPEKKIKKQNYSEIKNKNIKLNTLFYDKNDIEERKKKTSHDRNTKKVGLKETESVPYLKKPIKKTSNEKNAKKVELKETENVPFIKCSKNNTEKKLKRSRDVSEHANEKKKIKYDESGGSKHIVSKDLQSKELNKKMTSEKRKEKTQNTNKKSVLTSESSKCDKPQSQIRESRPKQSDKRRKESNNIGRSKRKIVELKTGHENECSEWDEESIVVEPSATNNSNSGFNMEQCAENNFKSRMIYDSWRNTREPPVQYKRQKRH